MKSPASMTSVFKREMPANIVSMQSFRSPLIEDIVTRSSICSWMTRQYRKQQYHRTHGTRSRIETAKLTGNLGLEMAEEALLGVRHLAIMYCSGSRRERDKDLYLGVFHVEDFCVFKKGDRGCCFFVFLNMVGGQ